jgi:hypothetical protein
MGMKTIWLFNDGGMLKECTTFPYAYRYLWNTLRKAEEAGSQEINEMKKRFRITSPVGKVYDYDDATALARRTGLLNTDGSLNSKEFRRQ